eukprot:tig00020554_g10824.t1
MPAEKKSALSALGDLSASIDADRPKHKRAGGEAADEIEEASLEEDVFYNFRKSAQHSKEPHRMHAGVVLAATEEVIRDKGLDLVPAAYFGAFMTSLENFQALDQQMIAATCHLLSMVFPKVSKGLLRTRFKQTAEILQRVHAHVAETAPAVKAVLECFGFMLTALDSSAWSQPIAQRVYNLVLSHCTDSRPKIRKRAHAEVRVILEGLHGSPTANNVAQTALQFCSTFTAKCSERNSLDTLHILGLYRLIMPILPAAQLKNLLKELSRLLGLHIAMVTQQVLLCLLAYAQDESKTPDADTATKILNLVSELEIPREDANISLPFLQLVTKTAADVCSADSQEGNQTLPLIVGRVATFFSVEQEGVLLAARDALTSLVRLIDTSLVDEYVSSRKAGSSAKRAPTRLERIIAHVESLLKFRYKHAWDASLQVFSALFRHLGRRGIIEPVNQLVVSAAELYDTADFHFKDQLSHALGAAISSFGPTHVLSLLPFNLEGADGEVKFSTSRVWLIKLLRENVQKGELRFFATQILPLASRLKTKAAAAAADARPIEAKNLMIVYSQLWELWPAFCNMPVDCAETFPNIAKNIGMTLENDSDLVPTLCTGLSLLINKFKDFLDRDESEAEHAEEENEQPSIGGVTFTKEGAQKSINAVARFSQQFITVLFNVFSTFAAEKRGPVFDAICAFTRISPAVGVSDRFKAILQKLAEAEVALASMEDSEAESLQKKEKERNRASMLMDLAIAFIPSLDHEMLQQLYRVLATNLLDSEAALQKRAYKLLGRISKNHPDWVASNIDEIQEMLIQSLAACATAAKKGRLKCLNHCMSSLSGDALTNFLGTLLGEVILATKEVNYKSREAAYNFLISAGRHMQEKSGDEGLHELLKMATAGLAGSHPHMISATIQALSRLLYEFRDEVSESLPEHIQNVILLFDHKSREIVSAALGFVKVAVVAFPPESLQPHLQELLQRLTNWSKDSKNHFRIKIRVIIERLYRKYGLEALEAVFPQEHIGLLRNIRKSKERAVKAKAQMTQKTLEERAAAKARKNMKKSANADFEKALEDASDDDDGIPVQGARAPANSKGLAGRAGKRAQTGIKQSANADPMDLLSHNGRFESGAAPHVARRPKSMFKTNEDGKIVVPSDSEEEELFPSKSGKRKQGGADAGVDVDLTDVLRAKRSGREIKKRIRDDYEPDEDEKEEGKKAKAGRFNDFNKKRRFQKGSTTPEKHTGAEYRSKKAPGDVTKTNRMQPYAYVPLGQRATEGLKKVKKGKVSGIVKGALKGSRDAKKFVKGSKQQKRHKK